MSMFSGDAHLPQAYPVILELLGDLVHFPLEAASKHVLAPACFWKEIPGQGKQVIVYMQLRSLSSPMADITNRLQHSP